VCDDFCEAVACRQHELPEHDHTAPNYCSRTPRVQYLTIAIVAVVSNKRLLPSGWSGMAGKVVLAREMGSQEEDQSAVTTVLASPRPRSPEVLARAMRARLRYVGRALPTTLIPALRRCHYDGVRGASLRPPSVGSDLIGKRTAWPVSADL
jgi:hypothetical protein